MAGANRMQLISTDTPRVRTYHEELRPVESLDSFLSSLRTGHKSGKLVLNYVNGSPRGYIEWTERTEGKD